MKVVAYASPRGLGRAIAWDIVRGLVDARIRRAAFWTLCLPSGRSCVPVLRALRVLPTTAFVNLRLLMPDAYCRDDELALCPCAEPHSVYQFVKKHLPRFWATLQDGGVADRLIVPSPKNPTEISDRLGAGDVDLMLLASGSGDGHVAFNSPGTSLESETRVVLLPESTRRDNLRTYPHFGEIANVPRRGVTIGMREILEWPKRTIMVLPGVEKAEALARVVSAHGYDPAWPATVISVCTNPCIYTDLEATRGRARLR